MVMAKRRGAPLDRPPARQGVLTRKQSEGLLHRTRSGRVRLLDPARRLNDFPLSNQTSTLPDHPPVGDGCLSDSISVKDLRSRRVFSPASTSFDNSVDQAMKPRAADDGIGILGKKVELQVGDRSDGLEDGLSQSTPSDSGFSCKSIFSGDGIGQGKRISKHEPQLDSRNQFKKRLGLAPCSRSKLYGNPNSFSYRRLLPFLMELDSSDDVKTLASSNYPAKKPLSHKVSPLPEEKHGFEGIEESLNAQRSDNSNVSEIIVGENHILRTLNVVDHKPTQKTVGIDERQRELNDVKPMATQEGATIELELMFRPLHSPPDKLEAPSLNELAGSTHAIPYLTDKVQGTQKVIFGMDRTPLSDTYQSRVPHPMSHNVLAPKKGILKRHTSGCRGPCTCLDCTIFLVHAQRAFEFSKKQMHGADDIIIGLMKELSCLRSIMEKSVLKVEEKECYSELQLNQVKGACQRALKAEETAKHLVNQMFNDLYTHCRIPGQRVTFAECVEQKTSQ